MENAQPFSIDDANRLIDLSESKALAGWGFAEQRLPDV
jgi:bifunctional non-homologous end joining protein LigD